MMKQRSWLDNTSLAELTLGQYDGTRRFLHPPSEDQMGELVIDMIMCMRMPLPTPQPTKDKWCR